MLSIEITKLSQSAAVEVVARRRRSAARRPRPRRRAARRRRRAPPPRRARRRRRRAATPRRDDERDLALRRLGEARRRARPPCPRTTSSNRFVSSRHTATSRAGSNAASERSDARNRCGDSNATTRSPRRASRARAPRARPALRGRKPTNAYEPPPRPLATSAVSTADGPGSTVTGICASSAARTRRAPGIGDERHPRIRDERDALSRLEPRQELRDARRFVVLVVGEQRRGDLVPLEQAARMARVLREHDVGGAELVEDAQRDVVEIADRRRADRERHVRALRTRPARRRSARPRRRAPRARSRATGHPERAPRGARRGRAAGTR